MKKTLFPFVCAAAALSVTVFASLLAGCAYAGHGSDSLPDAISAAGENSGNEHVNIGDFTAEEWLASLDSVDYGGYNFTVVTSRSNRFVPDEEMTGMVDPAIKKRNDLVEKKFNINISEVIKDENTIYAEMATAQNAGLHYADLVSVSTRTMSGLAANGCLMNIYSLPFFDEEAGYIDRETVESLTANDYLYVLYGDVSFRQEDCWCVFINTSLVPAGSAKEIKKAVTDGTWSWDKLDYFAQIAAAEVLDKRSPDYGTDIFGLCSDSDRDGLTMSMFESSGLRLFGDTYHQRFGYAMDTAAGDAVAKQIRDIMTCGYYLPLSGQDAVSAFKAGRVAFFACRMSFAEALSDVSFDWTLVPMPGYGDNITEYYSCLGQTACGISVPVHQANAERTARVLAALCASSNFTTAVTQNYTTFCLSDNDDAKMLAKIFANPVCDISVAYAKGFDRLYYLTEGTVLEAVYDSLTFDFLFTRNEDVLKSVNSTEFK